MEATLGGLCCWSTPGVLLGSYGIGVDFGTLRTRGASTCGSDGGLGDIVVPSEVIDASRTGTARFNNVARNSIACWVEDST